MTKERTAPASQDHLSLGWFSPAQLSIPGPLGPGIVRPQHRGYSTDDALPGYTRSGLRSLLSPQCIDQQGAVAVTDILAADDIDGLLGDVGGVVANAV